MSETTNTKIFQLKSEDKVSILLSLGVRLHAEETRYRNYEWKIAAVAGALTVGMISQIGSWAGNAPMKVAFTVFVSVVFTLMIVKLRVIHSNFILNRNLNKKVETCCGLFEQGEYVPGPSLLPKDWEGDVGPGHGCRVPITFAGMILVLGVYVVIRIWSP